MFRTRQVLPALFAFAAFAAAGPTAALAQACIGVPAANGQFAVSGAAGFTEGASIYGGDLTANVAGPVSVGVGYAMTDIDGAEENINEFSGTAAYEVSVAGFSACPATGASYSKISSEDEFGSASLSMVTVPVGLGFGKTFRAGGSLAVTPFAMPQLLYMRASFDTDSEADGMSESTNEFAGVAGLRVGVERFYVSGDVSHMFVEGAESVYSVGAGVIF